MSKNRIPVIGLIGAIGAGKTTVAQVLESYSGRVIDADRIGHQVLELPEIKKQILDIWGSQVILPTGEIDRRSLGRLVFSDPAERQKLEAVVFPQIGQLVDDAIVRAASDTQVRFVVLDAPVLLEAGWRNRCDRLIFVDAPREIRLKMLYHRSGWSAAELDRREAAQWPIDEKREHADVVIHNVGLVSSLQAQIVPLLTEWDLMEVPGH